MHNYFKMSSQKKENNLLVKLRSESNKCILSEFISLIYYLEFESEQIYCLIQYSADKKIAHKALLKAQDSSYYTYNNVIFAHFIEQMIEFFCTAEKVVEEYVIDVNDSQRTLKRKEIPETEIYKTDQLLLFLNKLHSTNEKQCNILMSFFICRSVYFAFFDKSNCTEHKRRKRLAREEQERFAEQIKLAEQ